MDYNEIKKLMEDMGNSKLDSLEIEFPDGVKISMTKDSNEEVVIASPQNNNSNVIEASAPITVPIITKKEENSLVDISTSNANAKDENYKIVKSPMVGTFYASSSPEKDAFVKVGDKVKKGQVLCIVEAMKLMNEIESEYDGEIAEICVKNEEIVEYGKPLFKIK